jgi:hypothetical protein
MTERRSYNVCLWLGPRRSSGEEEEVVEEIKSDSIQSFGRSLAAGEALVRRSRRVQSCQRAEQERLHGVQLVCAKPSKKEQSKTSSTQVPGGGAVHSLQQLRQREQVLADGGDAVGWRAAEAGQHKWILPQL